MPGRRPTPTALRELKGNPGKRPIPKREPKPARGIPTKPAWLSKAARKHWPKIAGELERMRVLTTADATALGLLCDALAAYIEARDIVAEEGLTVEVETEHGTSIRKHPAVDVRNEAWKRCRMMAIEFGLTPAARARVETSAPGEEENPFKLLLQPRSA